MNLLGELLLAGDHRNGWRSDFRKREPVARGHRLDWFDDYIADADIDMESDEGPAIDTRLNGMSRAASSMSNVAAR